MEVVFVGFKVNQSKSVMYEKIKFRPEQWVEEKYHNADAIDLGKPLAKAIKKGCDFVSIRFIKD